MKTSKGKAISKPIKTSKSGELVIHKKITTSKSAPSEENIRNKAMEIHIQRIKREEYGTAEDDWLEAERLLMDSNEE